MIQQIICLVIFSGKFACQGLRLTPELVRHSQPFCNDQGSAILKESIERDELFGDIGAHCNLMGGDWRDAWEWLPMQNAHDMSKSSGTNDCSKKARPNVIYLGHGHSGSSSLARQLNSHPNISYGSVKEHKPDVLYVPGQKKWHNLFSPSEPDNPAFWQTYMDGFDVPCGTKAVIDFSPGSLLMGIEHGGIDFQKVNHYLGNDVKFIIMLRDPFDFLDSVRSDSKLWYDLAIRHSFDCYVNGVERWMGAYPKASFLILRAEDYFSNEAAELLKVTNFIGVPPLESVDFVSSGRRRHVHTKDIEGRKKYHINHHECKERLEKLTGMAFPWPGSE